MRVTPPEQKKTPKEKNNTNSVVAFGVWWSDAHAAKRT